MHRRKRPRHQERAARSLEVRYSSGAEEVIPLGPYIANYLLVFVIVAVMAATVMLWVKGTGPECLFASGGCRSTAWTLIAPTGICLAGVIGCVLALRRRVLILCAEGIRRRRGRTEVLVRWNEVSLISLALVGVGKSTGLGVRIEYGLGRVMDVRGGATSVQELFRRIELYVAEHSLRVPTKDTFAA